MQSNAFTLFWSKIIMTLKSGSFESKVPTLLNPYFSIQWLFFTYHQEQIYTQSQSRYLKVSERNYLGLKLSKLQIFVII